MQDMSTDELAKMLWNFNIINQPLQRADCIFVMGSHDIRVAQYASEIFLNKYAPIIIFSGYKGTLTQGWELPEAEVFAQEALKIGVPKDKILIENKSTNTGENVLFTVQLLKEKNIKVKKIIVVQKPFMQKRAYATLKKNWPEIESIITAPQISYEEYPNAVISKDYLINTMVGDTQRLKTYGENGFQIPQKIPTQVWEAYQELVTRGYTKHLIKY